jgi:hypothetical protein
MRIEGGMSVIFWFVVAVAILNIIFGDANNDSRARTKKRRP